jgi:hypothetical protein
MKQRTDVYVRFVADADAQDERETNKRPHDGDAQVARREGLTPGSESRKHALQKGANRPISGKRSTPRP